MFSWRFKLRRRRLLNARHLLGSGSLWLVGYAAQLDVRACGSSSKSCCPFHFTRRYHSLAHCTTVHSGKILVSAQLCMLAVGYRHAELVQMRRDCSACWPDVLIGSRWCLMTTGRTLGKMGRCMCNHFEVYDMSPALSTRDCWRGAAHRPPDGPSWSTSAIETQARPRDMLEEEGPSAGQPVSSCDASGSAQSHAAAWRLGLASGIFCWAGAARHAAALSASVQPHAVSQTRAG